MSLINSAQNLETIAEEKPIKLMGSIQLNTGFYLADSFNTTQKPFLWSIIAAPVVSIYGVQAPINITVTQGSKTISNPFAQFGINPYYKWWKSYLGYTNMTWGDLSLNGKTFLGAGTEINPGLFRLGLMYGRFNPAILSDTGIKNGLSEQYTRSGYAGRIGIGNQKNYFDLMILRAHDHISSVPKFNESLTAPQANLLLGLKSFQTMLKERLIWSLEANVVAICKDLRSSDFNYDTTSPLKLLSAFIPIKFSTSYSWSVKNLLTYKAKQYSLSGEYLRIEPEYASFGIDYITNDLQKITLKETVRGLKNKSSFAFLQSYQNDNLNTRKSVTTSRLMSNITWNYNPNAKFGVTTNYSLFVINQSEGNKFLVDSIRLFQFNHNVMINPRLNLLNDKNSQNFSLILMYQGLNDENKKSIYKIEGKTFNVNFSHNIYLNKSKWNLNSSLNWLLTTNAFVKFMSMGPTFSMSNSFLKDKLYATYTLSYFHLLQNGLYYGRTLTNSLQANYTFDQHHGVRLNLNLMNTIVNITQPQNEYRGDLGYVYTF